MPRHDVRVCVLEIMRMYCNYKPLGFTSKAPTVLRRMICYEFVSSFELDISTLCEAVPAEEDRNHNVVIAPTLAPVCRAIRKIGRRLNISQRRSKYTCNAV